MENNLSISLTFLNTEIYTDQTSVDYSYGRTITTLGEMEMYKSNSYEVQVDHEDKSMMIHKVKESKMDMSGIDLKELKKLISSENDKIAPPVYQLLSNQNGVKTYTLKDYQTIKECTIVLNMQTFAIDKIIYEYTPESESKGQYCIIDYTVFDYMPNFEKGKFETNHFFILKEGAYQAVSRLKNYRIIVE